MAGLGACERFSNETWRGGWAPEVVGAVGTWGSVDGCEAGRICGATTGRAGTRRGGHGEARAGEAEKGPWYAGCCGADARPRDGDETEAWERGEMAREGKEEGREEGREEAMAESEDVEESGGRELAGSG